MRTPGTADHLPVSPTRICHAHRWTDAPPNHRANHGRDREHEELAAASRGRMRPAMWGLPQHWPSVPPERSSRRETLVVENHCSEEVSARPLLPVPRGRHPRRSSAAPGIRTLNLRLLKTAPLPVGPERLGPRAWLAWAGPGRWAGSGRGAPFPPARPWPAALFFQGRRPSGRIRTCGAPAPKAGGLTKLPHTRFSQTKEETASDKARDGFPVTRAWVSRKAFAAAQAG